MSTLHERLRNHPYSETCFGCKAGTLQLDGKGLNASRNSRMEKGWERDMPAYASLRRDGFNPAHIDGCAELVARDATRFEIESGLNLGPKDKVEEAIRIVEDATGRGVMDPVTTPLAEAV